MPPPGSLLARLLGSSSLRSAAGFGIGGIGYAVATIVLAKVLPTNSFGVVTLVLALSQFGLTLGPFGLEIVANRHRPRANRGFALLVFSLAALTGVFIAVVAGVYYHLSTSMVYLVFAIVVGTATNRVGAALFQGEQRLPLAMTLLQVHNFVLLAVALWATAMIHTTDVFVVSVVTLGYLLSAVGGWWLALRTVNRGRVDVDLVLALKEGAAAMGIGIAVQLLMQFERLAIPKLGSLEMLSTYAVLAATVGSPFRMLQMGTSFSLLPRLRSAQTAAAARSVLFRESALSLGVALLAAAAIWLASPLIFATVLGGKYPIDNGLIVASIVIGLARMWEGFSTTVVSALGSARGMALISAFAWACLAVAAGGAIFGSRYGLLGILWGVGLAWLLLATGGTYLAAASFRARFSGQSTR